MLLHVVCTICESLSFCKVIIKTVKTNTIIYSVLNSAVMAAAVGDYDKINKYV